MSKFTHTAILLLSLGAFALPASAGDRHDRHARKGHAYERHHDADWDEPRHRRGPRLRRLAYELEDVSGDLLRRLRKSCGGEGYAERKALYSFEKLHDRARHYLAEVERSSARSRHAQRDFRRLKKAFRKAQARLHYLEPRRKAREDFSHVRFLIRELDERYAYAQRRVERDRYAHHRGPRLPAPWWFEVRR